MDAANPIDLLFGGMEKLGPGGDQHTSHVLESLPNRKFELIVDAGCGTGRQTLLLARDLDTRVHAVDSYRPFLDQLNQRAKGAGLDALIQTHCIDMQTIPEVFRSIDLLWSEGAAYNIGFSNALSVWASAMKQGGFVVVSELSWLKDEVPEAVKRFFLSGYPDMGPVSQNVSIAENAGYEVLSTYAIPSEAWVDGYYDILEPRAKALADHTDASVREFAEETLEEIKVFRQSDNSYGYVFYILRAQ